MKTTFNTQNTMRESPRRMASASGSKRVENSNVMRIFYTAVRKASLRKAKCFRRKKELLDKRPIFFRSTHQYEPSCIHEDRRPLCIPDTSNEKLLAPRSRVTMREDDCVEFVLLELLTPDSIVFLHGYVHLLKELSRVCLGPVVDKHFFVGKRGEYQIPADIVIVEVGTVYLVLFDECHRHVIAALKSPSEFVPVRKVSWKREDGRQREQYSRSPQRTMKCRPFRDVLPENGSHIGSDERYRE